MIHMMLTYPNVVKNPDLCKISTIPLELQLGVRLDSESEKTEDVAYVISEIEIFWMQLDLDEWRL